MAKDELFVLIWSPKNAKDRHPFKGCDVVINIEFSDVLNVRMIMQGKLRGTGESQKWKPKFMLQS